MTDSDKTSSQNVLNSNLSEKQKKVLFEKATEPPFSGKYLDYHGNGKFVCANCGKKLFDSSTKFDSGSGWPSFYEAIDSGAIKTEIDKSHFMVRTEILCANCGGHLGHLFNDGPNPTGLRYCVNSLSIEVTES
jgi:peptide-methionine (R)-S-oxide reductase